MNERIKELANEAGYHPDVYELCRPGMEKFAELIIKECIQAAGPGDSYRDHWFYAKADSVLRIKQRFDLS